ncbi:MAG TPA: shikimate dehydrogenase [Actinomycetota bacterium]|nr:shikimate dehydrogenase [Actinomycetota bacterium]
MSGSPTGATRVACIIGWPASHSLSPVIHNAAFAAAGLDWVYVAFPVAPDDVAAAVTGMRALGIAGANVTMPHKRAVMALMDELTPAAERIGAVNTIVANGGTLIGDNTDGAGLVAFLTGEAGFDPAGRRVTLLGAGGAARAVAVALADAGSRVRIAARRAGAVSEVAALCAGEVVPWDARGEAAAQSDLIVNATPVGADGEGSPLEAGDLPTTATIVDLLYSPAETPLLRAAAARGLPAHNGLGMLVHQAALAFEQWTGTPAPVDAMAAAVRARTAAKPSL